MINNYIFVNKEIEMWIDLVNLIHKEVMNIYNTNFEIFYKEDKSPVTEADKLVSKLIEEKLSIWFPNIPIISEENKEIPYEERKNWKYFFLVDPIDGTKEFINKNGEFTVNIGLCLENKPIFGIVTIPATNIMYYAEINKGAWKIDLNTLVKKSIKCKPKRLDDAINIIISKSHLDKETTNFIDKINNKNTISSGSSIKFMKVAEGEADLYPRFGNTMEWDICASQIIVEEAGGCVLNYPDNSIMVYNKESLLNGKFLCQVNNKN